MTIVMSPVQKIENIQWVKIDPRGMNAQKVVMVDGTMYVLVGPNKIASSNKSLCSNYAFTPSDWSFNNSMLKALVSLGIITKEDVAIHKAVVNQRVEERQLKHDQASYDALAKKYGAGVRPGAKKKHK